MRDKVSTNLSIAFDKTIKKIAPFEERLNSDNFRKFISSKVQDFLLTTTKHPKLLVPFAITEG